MMTFIRVAGAIWLMLVAGFCGFGFLATFEPGPNVVAWRIGYGVTGLACLAAAAWLLLGASRPNRR